MKSQKWSDGRRTRGAAAVEFALVLPILIVLVMGIIEFGFYLFLLSSAAGAAREGAREMAIHQVQADAEQRANDMFDATTGNPPTAVSVPGSCDSGDPVSVTVTYTYPTFTRFFGVSFTAQGTGEMRCGG